MCAEDLFGDKVWEIDWDVMVCVQLDGVLDSVTSRRFSASGGVSCKEKRQIHRRVPSPTAVLSDNVMLVLMKQLVMRDVKNFIINLLILFHM
jgi:hypothetical protein